MCYWIIVETNDPRMIYSKIRPKLKKVKARILPRKLELLMSEGAPLSNSFVDDIIKHMNEENLIAVVHDYGVVVYERTKDYYAIIDEKNYNDDCCMHKGLKWLRTKWGL